MKNRNEELKRKLKKAASISLCAVLAGGLAAGTYTGVNYLTGYEQSVQAASKEQVTLLKSDKESDDSDSKEESTAKGSLDVSDIVEETMPSIVSITTKSVEEVQSYYGMFGQYGAYSPEQREVQGSGSGIIIGKNDTELLIATNYHVVDGAETLSVGFCDSTACEAKVKGYDSEKDLAVVAVSLDDIDSDTMDAISIATIGNSDNLKVGEQVVAIGNALGYGQSVTTGIVSAKNRQLNSDDTVGDYDSDSNSATNLIQTDAAINPGNSGGALLNMNGEVVGINSAKLASTEVEGIGYAIAISDVTDTIESLMNEETRDKVEDHGVLGIIVQTVDSAVTEAYGVPEGVLVREVTEGGAADDAGIEARSIITKFAGKTVTTKEQLVDFLSYYEPGEDVELTIEVPDGKEYKEETVTVTLGKSEDTQNADSKDSQNQDGATDEDGNLLEDWQNNEGGAGLQYGEGWN
ncbi:Putative serine protease HtrA [uncultured Blautia sp.]|uniref:S1C family serine protease n=1 Tax=Blautia acetigignens TaxID=2981783 RepID=UPI0008229F65|nr:trypsin-like peptidase domain-containing protein [Blautia acetigignens]MCU6775308.1 trypsin-like peptidase domain-containing protein [Blautia acetigignens]SCH73920.1 Putative serine protease HtrA [uncultured Blautia sp.]